MKSPFNPLRGWHVLVLILAFFGVTIGVNAAFITLALRTHPGEDVPRSYVQGLNYNETLERRRAQEELGWSAHYNLVDDGLVIEVLDREGAPVSGLQLAGAMIHPTDTSRDCEMVFEEDRSGVYRVDLPCREAGQWRVHTINTGELPFEMEHDLWLP